MVCAVHQNVAAVAGAESAGFAAEGGGAAGFAAAGVGVGGGAGFAAGGGGRVAPGAVGVVRIARAQLLGGDEPRANLSRMVEGRRRTAARVWAAVKMGRVTVAIGVGFERGGAGFAAGAGGGGAGAAGGVSGRPGAGHQGGGGGGAGGGGVVQGIATQPRNTDVQLTFGPAETAGCETRDAFDRAHGIMGPSGLLPAAVRLGGRHGRISRPLAGSRARRYPASSMTSRGVAFDSAYDQLRELQDELDGIDGIGRSSQVTMGEVLRERLGRMSDQAVRKLCRYGE